MSEITVGCFIEITPQLFNETKCLFKNEPWVMQPRPVRVALIGTNSLVIGYDREFYGPIPNEAVKVLWTPAMKRGDRAVLTKTPVIDGKEAWGWMGSKHFLIEGRTGKIASTDCYYSFKDNTLCKGYGFIPDNQTWINSVDGEEKDVTDPSVYGFSEDDLRLMQASEESDDF